MAKSVVVKITADTTEFKKQVNALRAWAITLNKESIKTASRLSAVYRHQNKQVSATLKEAKKMLAVEGERGKKTKAVSLEWAKVVTAMKSAVSLGRALGGIATTALGFGSGIANAATRSGLSMRDMAAARRYAIGFGLTGEEGMAQAEGIKASQRQFKIGQGGALYKAAATYGMGMDGIAKGDAIDVIETFAKNALQRGLSDDSSINMAEMAGIRPELLMRAMKEMRAGTYEQYESGVRKQAVLDEESARKSIEANRAYQTAIEDLKSALVDLLPMITSAIKWFTGLGDGTKILLAGAVVLGPAIVSLGASLAALWPSLVALAGAVSPVLLGWAAAAAAAAAFGYGLGEIVAKLVIWVQGLLGLDKGKDSTEKVIEHYRSKGVDEESLSLARDLYNSGGLKSHQKANDILTSAVQNNNTINIHMSSNATPTSVGWAVLDLGLRGAQ